MPPKQKSSDPHCFTHGWFRCSAPRVVYPKFRYVHGLGLHDANADIQDPVKLLRHDATNKKHPAVRDKTSTAVTSGVLSLTQLDYGSVILAGLPRTQ